jgi:DNA polymerase-3 subunit alpha
MALAGFSAGQAEAAMKAMSKKNAAAMEELRPAFLAGAEARGVERAVAEQIYEVMYNFASYGFNLNHSAAYAVLSYQTAYLKANYPHEFMATNLSSIVDKRDKLALYVADVRRMGIELLPPCVNQGAADFSVEPSAGSTGAGGTGARFAAAIRIGLHAVKNVGHPCVEAILRARREGGPFTDLADFCRRVFVAAESQAVTRTAVECLIRSGALTCLGGNRAQLLAALDGALAGASSIRRARAQGQSSLFTEGDAAGASAPLTLPALPELSRAELLSLERDLLGVYVTDHPLREVAGALRAAVTAFAADLPEKQDREPVTVGGIIAQVTVRMTRRGEAMANVTLEDETGSLTAVFFPKAYERCRELLEADRIVVIKGRASVRDRVVEDEDTPAQVEVQAEELSPLESRAVRRPTNVHLRLRAARRGELLVLQRLFANNPGDSRLLIHVDHGEREETVLSRLRVGISAQLISEAQALANRVGGQVWVD